MLTSKDLIAIQIIIDFIGVDNFTNKQIDSLNYKINQLSIAEKDFALKNMDLPSGCYTDLSMRNAEMGGFERY